MTDEAHPPPARYTLGDSALAGDRLALLAEVFGPSTRALVRAWRPSTVRLAVDLGCGPGHTTRLLADELLGAEVTGLDASAAFVERARREHGGPGVRFVVHDATVVPFPTPPPDLVLARYLLSHLPGPIEVVGRWVGQLARGGRVLVDEVEAIDTTVEVFATYLEISGGMIAAQGADLYVGSMLVTTAPPTGARVVHTDAVAVAPTTATVASLFGMNLATWRHDPWVVGHVEPAVLDGLATGLARLERSSGEGAIVWRQRQVVYESVR